MPSPSSHARRLPSVGRRAGIAALLILALALPVTAATRPGWVSIGPEAGRVQALAVSTAGAPTVYAGTADGGVFRSTNGGAAWTPASRGLVSLDVNLLAVDPTNPRTVYAATEAGVQRSGDGGATWGPASPLFTWALAIAPSAPRTLYAADYRGVVFGSVDSGAHWSELGAPVTTGEYAPVQALAVDPSQKSTLYAATGSGFFRSDDGAQHWTAANNGLTDTHLHSLTVDPFSHALYAGSGSRIFKSSDRGATWVPLTGLPQGPWTAVVSSPFTRGALLAAADFSTLAVPDPTQDIWRSQDGGANWSIDLQASASQGAIHPISALVFDPTRPRGGVARAALAGVDPFGVLRSARPGADWLPAMHGLRAAAGDFVAPDPSKPAALYAAFSIGASLPIRFGFTAPESVGVWKTTDGGATWEPIRNGLAVEGVRGFPSVKKLAIDPRQGGTVYAGTANGLFRTTDGGALWQPVGPSFVVAAVAVDPGNPRHLLAAGFVEQTVDNGSVNNQVPVGRAFASTDGGTTWQSLLPLLGRTDASAAPFEAVSFDPRNPSTLYLAGSESFVSRDGGGSWQKFADFVPVFDLGVDATETSLVYLTDPFHRSLLVSHDGGGTFTPVGTFPGDYSPFYLAVPHGTGKTVLVSTLFDLVLSRDDGATWSSVGDHLGAGLTEPTEPWRGVAFDPFRPGVAYATALVGSGLLKRAIF